MNRSDWRWVLCCGWVNSMLFFLPVLRDLGGGGRNPFTILYRAFFHSDDPEILIGDGVDPLGSFWIVSKVRHMLTGESQTILPDLYAPTGFDIALHEGYAWADTLLAMPWEMLIGSPGFYNIHVFQTMFLSFVAAAALFRIAGAPLFYAIILANIAILHPFAVGEVAYGRPTQMNWIFICAFLIGIIKMHRGHRLIFWSIWTGATFAVACLVYWFGAVSVGLCAAIVYGLSSMGKDRPFKFLLAGLNSAIIAVGLCLSVTWRVSKDVFMGRANKAYAHLSQTSIHDIDLGFLTIPIRRIETLESLSDLREMVTLSSIPLLALIVGVTALLRKVTWLKNWPWIIALIVALGIPLDFGISIGGWTIPTGYSLLQSVFPPVIRCTFADRMMVAPTLFLLLVFALSVTPQWDSRKLRVFFLALLLVNLSHSPTRGDMYSIEFSPSKALMTLNGGLIEIPFEQSNSSYVQQLWHGQQIIGGPGIMKLRGRDHQRYFNRNRLLSGLESLSHSNSIATKMYRGLDILQLRKDGFRYLVFYSNYLPYDVYTAEQFLGSKAAIVEEEGLWIFDLAKVPIP